MSQQQRHGHYGKGAQGMPGDSSEERSRHGLGADRNTDEEKIAELGMLALEERRHQTDVCLIHKIMHREGDLNPATWFERIEQTAGGHATRSTSDPLHFKVRKGRLETSSVCG